MTSYITPRLLQAINSLEKRYPEAFKVRYGKDYQLERWIPVDDPVVTISKSEPFNYHPRDFRDTMLDLEDWREAVKLAQELALTPLNERGKVINHDWVKRAQKSLRGILGRG